MSELSLASPVGAWAAQHPRTSRVFESMQIDYCCGGEKPLEAACRERSIDPEAVVAQLREAIDALSADQQETNWADAPLTALCDHIEQTHHAYLRSELPRLTGLIEKVVGAHGDNHPELAELSQVFTGLRNELEPHMFKEERILFPAIRQLEQSDSPPAFPFGTVANPIRMMEHEHDNAGGALAEMRRLTSDYRVPNDACNTYRALYDGLESLEQDLHQHIHKENNILFPRAHSLEGASSN